VETNLSLFSLQGIGVLYIVAYWLMANRNFHWFHRLTLCSQHSSAWRWARLTSTLCRC